MKIRRQRFNIYLLVVLVAAGAWGCQSQREHKSSGSVKSTLRLYLEVTSDGTKGNEPVPVYRARPIMVNVDKAPFLTEGNVAEAKVVDELGGFALRLRFDHPGTTLLEQYAAANRGRRIVVFSQFGKGLQYSRWLGAPMILRHISDGVLTFTPDATHEEAEEIALGLNNVAKKVHSWIEK